MEPLDVGCRVEMGLIGDVGPFLGPVSECSPVVMTRALPILWQITQYSPDLDNS